MLLKPKQRVEQIARALHQLDRILLTIVIVNHLVVAKNTKLGMVNRYCSNFEHVLTRIEGEWNSVKDYTRPLDCILGLNQSKMGHLIQMFGYILRIVSGYLQASSLHLSIHS